MREPTARDRTFARRFFRQALLAVLLVVGLNLPGTGLTSAIADETGQVALVIQYDEARVETLCLPLVGESVTGMELLDRSGLRMIVQPGSSLGVTICQIEEVGCAYPAKACFCQCMGGGDCAYWNYFFREPGGDWIYSALGAVMHKVQPGAVEAWVWGDGTQPPADELTFEILCPSSSEALPSEALPSEALPSEPLPTNVPLPLPTTAPTVPLLTTAESVAAVSEQPEADPTVALVRPASTATLPAPTPMPTPTPQAEAAGGSSLASYGLFAAMALALVGIGLWVKGRQA